MKNITLLLLLTLLAAFVSASPEAEAAPAPAPDNYGPNNLGADWGKRACKRKAPNVQRAIERYCTPAPGAAGRNIPGARGSTGTRVGNAIVSIDASCNPAQYLPWDVCFKQFHSMCIFQFPWGRGTRTYGKNGCQKWTIGY